MWQASSNNKGMTLDIIQPQYRVALLQEVVYKIKVKTQMNTVINMN